MSYAFNIDIINLPSFTSKVASWDIIRNVGSNIKLRKVVVRYLVALFNEYMSSQVFDVMIRYERDVTENSCKSEIYMSYN